MFAVRCQFARIFIKCSLIHLFCVAVREFLPALCCARSCPSRPSTIRRAQRGDIRPANCNIQWVEVMVSAHFMIMMVTWSHNANGLYCGSKIGAMEHMELTTSVCESTYCHGVVASRNQFAGNPVAHPVRSFRNNSNATNTYVCLVPLCCMNCSSHLPGAVNSIMVGKDFQCQRPPGSSSSPPHPGCCETNTASV